jgi:uncharacterized SAM-binding protein YcdF (DUF218 family)
VVRREFAPALVRNKVVFVLKRLLESFVLPPFGPLLLIFVGLCLLRWRRRAGLVLAWSGALLSLCLMLPATVDLVLTPLENVAPPVNPETARRAEVIVILGGGGRRDALEYGHSTLNHVTLERVRYGARLARETGLPVLVSGGVAGGNYPEARMMAEALREDFGIEPRWVEARSENTEQNARYTAEILRREGLQRVLLVTHAAHMRRALGYFNRTDLQVTPAPTVFLGPLLDPERPLSWLPSASAAHASWYAMHEWAGLLQQRFSK